MREGWVEAELMNVCTLQRGFDLPRKDRTSGAVPLMSSSGSIDRVAIAKVAGPGVVTGRSGSIGQVYFVEDNFWPLNTTLYVKDFHGNYPRFVYYLLSNFDLTRFTSGAGVPTLNRNHVHNELVRIPRSITEQKRIVAILDEAFAGIATAVANTKRNLANARELFEGYLDTVFGSLHHIWGSSTLKDSCHIKPPKKEVRDRHLRDEMVSFVPMNDLGVREKRLRSMENRPLGSVLDTYTYFADGDVLLAKITPCFENGKIGIASELTNGIGFGSSEFVVFRPRGFLCAEYLFYFLSRDSFRSAGAKVMSGAVGHKRVPKEFLEGCLIPLPPLPEQQRIVVILDGLSGEIRRLESIYQEKLEALVELKKSLLKRAFSGEFTAIPQDEIETARA